MPLCCGTVVACVCSCALGHSTRREVGLKKKCGCKMCDCVLCLARSCVRQAARWHDFVIDPNAGVCLCVHGSVSLCVRMCLGAVLLRLIVCVCVPVLS